MKTATENLHTVCQALAALQTALVDESTERGPLSPRLDKALRDSWAKWSPDDADPTRNLNTPAAEPAPADFVLPTIHINGSSPERLREDYTAARNAVEEATRKLCAIDLNGRDYYPQGNGAFKKAQEQMCSQLQRLSSVRDELVKLEEHCHSFVK